VLTITLGYGAFLLNWGIAHVLLYQLASGSRPKDTVQNLTEYLYRSLQIGVILLASGTILGGVWASYSWGRFWGWDPKETWALIALLTYLAVLHGRTAGWLDQFGVAFWSALCFLSVLMAWYGVNFVLGAGLHSYGFGGGGLQYVLAVVLADIAFLLFLARKFRTAQ
jgi:ABC-type transport system involved in cytochrome c biogenesis permease subunit